MIAITTRSSISVKPGGHENPPARGLVPRLDMAMTSRSMAYRLSPSGLETVLNAIELSRVTRKPKYSASSRTE